MREQTFQNLCNLFISMGLSVFLCRKKHCWALLVCMRCFRIKHLLQLCHLKGRVSNTDVKSTLKKVNSIWNSTIYDMSGSFNMTFELNMRIFCLHLHTEQYNSLYTMRHRKIHRKHAHMHVGMIYASVSTFDM